MWVWARILKLGAHNWLLQTFWWLFECFLRETTLYSDNNHGYVLTDREMALNILMQCWELIWSEHIWIHPWRRRRRRWWWWWWWWWSKAEWFKVQFRRNSSNTNGCYNQGTSPTLSVNHIIQQPFYFRDDIGLKSSLNRSDESSGCPPWFPVGNTYP